MGDLGVKNQGDRDLWSDPDPRVNWALDLFDDQGYETLMYQRKFFSAAATGAFGVACSMLYNVSINLPLRARLPHHAAFFATGWGIGTFFQNYRGQRRAQQEAVIKHYIMLHPDRFPEPEMMKFGDKKCVLPWMILRQKRDVPIDPYPNGKKEE